MATADGPAVLRAMCESGSVLAVLPDALSASVETLVRLRDVPCVVPIYAVSRRPIVPSSPIGSRVGDLVDRLRHLLE